MGALVGSCAPIWRAVERDAWLDVIARVWLITLFLLSNGLRLTCRPPRITVHRPAARSDAPRTEPTQPAAGREGTRCEGRGRSGAAACCPPGSPPQTRRPDPLLADRSAALMPTATALLSALRTHRSAKGCSRREPPPAPRVNRSAGGLERDATPILALNHARPWTEAPAGLLFAKTFRLRG